ncbi:TolC family protein [Phocaeicola sp.]
MMKSLKAAMLSLCMVMGASATHAQLTLDECQRLAQDNYPLLKKYDLINRSTDYSISNIRKGYWPQLSFSGQATYQSGVASLPDALTGILGQTGYDAKGLKKDQYKVGVDLNQTVWDGGNLNAQKQAASAEGGISVAQTDVDMYAIRNRVNDLFFGILLMDDRLRINEDLQALLLSNCNKLEVMLKNGTAMPYNVDAMRAEYLKTRQQMTELNAARESYLQMLSLFIGKEAAALLPLQKPDETMPVTRENFRPELRLFDAQLSQADARRKLINSGIRPKISLFAQGYYGYPGMDFFSDMFDHDWTLNGMVGVRLNWNISNLYTHKDELRKISLMRNRIENAREVFLFNNRLQTTQEEKTIERYRQVMADDDEIIRLRTSVRKAAESKLNNGIIDVNDLLQEITNENRARLQHSSHEIEMLKAIYELKNTVNQ